MPIVLFLVLDQIFRLLLCEYSYYSAIVSFLFLVILFLFFFLTYLRRTWVGRILRLIRGL